jgi:hypothetical protein
MGALLIALVLTGCVGGAGRNALSLSGGGINHCVSPSGERTWGYLETHPSEFALDLYTVRGSAPVTVTGAELAGNNGLRLTDAVFVPGGAVGDGFDFGDLHAVDFPAAWAARQQAPHARLTRLTPTKSPVQGSWSQDPEWQLIIGIVPTSPKGGYAQHVDITYAAGGRTYQVSGTDKVGILPTTPECLKAGGK